MPQPAQLCPSAGMAAPHHQSTMKTRISWATSLSECVGLVFIPHTGATRAPCCTFPALLCQALSPVMFLALCSQSCCDSLEWGCYRSTPCSKELPACRFHAFCAVLTHPPSFQVSLASHWEALAVGQGWLGKGPWWGEGDTSICITELDSNWDLMMPQILEKNEFQKKPYSRYILPKVQAWGGGKYLLLPEQPAFPVQGSPAQLSQTSPGVHGLREGTDLQPGCSTPLPPHLFFVRGQWSWLHNKEHRGNTHLETSACKMRQKQLLSWQAWLDAQGRRP